MVSHRYLNLSKINISKKVENQPPLILMVNIIDTCTLVLCKTWSYLSKNQIKFDYPHHAIIEHHGTMTSYIRFSQWVWHHCAGFAIPSAYGAVFNYHMVRIIRFYVILWLAQSCFEKKWHVFNNIASVS